jgi:hypothetical protein
MSVEKREVDIPLNDIILNINELTVRFYSDNDKYVHIFNSISCEGGMFDRKKFINEIATSVRRFFYDNF